MKYKVLLIVSFILLSGQVKAQRFEWAKGFAAGENVAIVGSVADSVGNLYILGSINFNTCWENGSRLLPIAPHGYAQDNGDVLIAKISPAGDLVWHKVIHGEGANSIPHDIKLVGDSTFACLVTMPLASEVYYLYYLDTFIVSGGWGVYPEYPMSALYFSTGASTTTALITFDFEGNVKEQHFLYMSYLDYNGNDIVRTYPDYPQPWYQANTLQHPSFAFDTEGNIYLSRWAFDYTSAGPGMNYYVENGTISAVKFWCDCHVVGIAPTDSHLVTSPQILKFSPHFDTLLGSRYVFQRGVNIYDIFYPYIQTDNWNNVYIVGDLDNTSSAVEGVMIIDSLRNIGVLRHNYTPLKGFLVKYNSDLTPRCALSLSDSIIGGGSFHYSMSMFNDIAFDYDSALLFLNGTFVRTTFGDTTNFWTLPVCQGIPLPKLKNDAFFLSFKMQADTLSFHSFGRVDSKYGSDCVQASYHEHGKLVACNNRIYMQSINVGGVRFPGQNIVWSTTPSISAISSGLTIFDYQGNVIYGQHYAAFGASNTVGPIVLKDSVLYLFNHLTSGATFGDIDVPSRGKYFACIAKYVDTSFMTSYVSPVARIQQADSATMAVYPNPTTGKVHVILPSAEPANEAYVVDLTGHRLKVSVCDGMIDLAGAPSGILFLQVVTSNHVYSHRIIKP